MAAPPARRHLARLAAAVAVLASGGIAVVAGATRPVAEAALANETFDRTTRPLGAITVIGDSVLQGSVIYSPTLADQLASRGWGPIRVRAGVGYRTKGSGEVSSAYWIQRWRQEGWDAPDVVVNLGANDSGNCDRDVACARNLILQLVNTIGPGHRVWWPKITRYRAYQHQADTWNTALDQIAAERADFFTWDWAGSIPPAYFAWDDTHLSPTGYRLRSQLMAYEITADLALASRTGSDAALPTGAGVASELVPIDPVRIIDTREDPPGRVAAGAAIEVDVSAEIPPGATAVAAYVSATRTGDNGFLTAYECSAGRPKASSANYLKGETRGAVAITPVSATGRFCLYTSAAADLLVDLQAAFVPSGSGGARLTPLATPSRLVDTRGSGRAQRLEVAVPGDADAAAVSVTAINSLTTGYLVVYPCTDTVPLIATVNHFAGELISGTAFVPVGPDGTICVWSSVPVDVTVDLTGVFSSGGELVFVPVPPTRMLDTRSGTGGWSPIHGRHQVLDARVVPPTARAVSGTLTFVAPMRTGFLRAWGCGAPPGTANVTARTGSVLANSVTTGVDADGRLCFYSEVAAGTLFDTTGWWVPAS